MGDYLWVFTIDSASELPAKPGKERTVHVEAQLITMGGKIEQTVNTPVVNGCDPVWNYKVFQYPHGNIQNKYSNIKFKIYDGKELLGQARINWEFIGEPPKDKFYTLRITGKKKDAQVGKIKVHTVYQKFAVNQSASGPLPSPAAARAPHLFVKSASVGGISSAPLSGSQRTAEAIRKLREQGGVIEVKDFKREDVQSEYVKNSRVQFSAAGRRFIQIPTSGIEKFITFNELPPFEFENITLDKHTKDELLKSGFSLNNALWLTTCAQLAYKDEEVIYDVCKNVWDMKGCIFVESRVTDTQGFCMYNDQICVVCFRGTESLKDWKTNLNFVLIPGNFPDRYQQAGVKVHQGFFTALTAVWDQVSEFVEQAFSLYPHIKLIICGHSLGGALANLCFSFFTLTDNPKPVYAVYTIGQPRVGNRKFKQTLEQSSPNTRYMRITNNQDIVPNLAAGQHCGIHVHITANGRFSFKSPVWKKAVNEVQSIQNSAAGMQYAGIADHSSAVYRKLIEQNWTRYLVLKSNSNAFNLFELAEQSSIIIDMVTEAVKGVRSYKPQFRAAVAQIILTKPLLDSASDYAVFMTAAQQHDTQKNIQGINSILSKFQKEIIDNQKEKSVIQRSITKEKNFNKRMKQFCQQIQNYCDGIHDTLHALNPVYDEQVGSNSTGFSISKYDVSSYKIEFCLINFDEISTKALQTRRTKNKSEEIGLMIDTAEEMMLEGELSVCLQFLQKIPAQPEYERCATDEQKANYSYLLAKCHAMLHHDNEAMNALKELSKCSAVTDDLIQDQAFTNICTTAQFQAIANTVQQIAKQKHIYEEKLKPDEIEVFSAMFDAADEAGDGYLTLAQFQQLIESNGIENILHSVGWKSGKSVVLQVYSILQKIENDCKGQVNLQQFLDLMSSLLPAECAKTSTKSKSRRSQPNTAAPVWNLFTPPN